MEHKDKPENGQFNNVTHGTVPIPKPQYERDPEHGRVKHWYSWLKFKHSHLTKKQKMVVWLVILVLLAIGIFGSYLLYKHFHQRFPDGVSHQEKSDKPTTEPSRLTGYPVDPALNERPVTGIMIENSPEARPQSGLNDAGIVFEAVAEGGITRFLALYQEAQPQYIGPVRSVRPYYLDWVLPFGGSLAHVGGSPQALAEIKVLNVRDLDQFANPGAYWRIAERYAPHNVYTSFERLDALNKAKGYTYSDFTSLNRKKEMPAAQPNASVIDFALSNSILYNVHYDYDPATNSYKRSEGGAPHIDEKSGAQLTPKTVIAMVIPRGIASDGQHTDYAANGSGKVYVFEDGTVIEGTWTKPDRRLQFHFNDASGANIGLNPGQTWITMVDAPTSVTYRP